MVVTEVVRPLAIESTQAIPQTSKSLTSRAAASAESRSAETLPFMASKAYSIASESNISFRVAFSMHNSFTLKGTFRKSMKILMPIDMSVMNAQIISKY